jgi:hypothetical protein
VLRTVNAAYFFGFCGLVLALIALHAPQARQAGGFGTSRSARPSSAR